MRIINLGICEQLVRKVQLEKAHNKYSLYLFYLTLKVLTCVVILLIGVTYGYELFGKDQLEVFNPNYNSRVFRYLWRMQV